MFKEIGFEIILKDPYIIKKNRILILYYIDNIVFAFNNFKKEEVNKYTAKFKSKYYLIGGDNF